MRVLLLIMLLLLLCIGGGLNEANPHPLPDPLANPSAHANPLPNPLARVFTDNPFVDEKKFQEAGEEE